VTDKGLQIEVTEREFLKKTLKQQNLILYKALTQINGTGCRWARGRWKKLFVYGTGAGFAGGFTAMLAKLAFWR